jgi:hypothetical protein
MNTVESEEIPPPGPHRSRSRRVVGCSRERRAPHLLGDSPWSLRTRPPLARRPRSPALPRSACAVPAAPPCATPGQPHTHPYSQQPFQVHTVVRREGCPTGALPPPPARA